MPHSLKIIDTDVNGVNGHHVVHARIVETCEDGPGAGSTVESAIESHGIDAMSLDNLYGGSVEKWLTAVGVKMMARHAQQCKSKKELLDMKGKHIDINPAG